MGLLDALGSDQGLLGLALMSAGSAKPVRTGLGEGLLQGMQLVQQNRNAREDRAQRMRMQQMQEQALQMQMDERKRAQDMQAQRGQYLGALDANQGPPMQMTPAGALAAGLSPQEMSILAPQQADPMAGIEKVSPKDYTPESWTQFVQTRNPAVLRAAPKDQAPDDFQRALAAAGIDPASPIARKLAMDRLTKLSTHQPATSVSVNTADRIPTTLVKQQDDLIDKMTTARAIEADLGAVYSQIESGKLKFGPVRNLANTAKNVAGLSDDESRAFGTFKSTLEKLRNDSLRLNTGVQTEGDAQRAWNELFQNINDTEFVKQRLAEIRNINQRAAQLHEYRLNTLRQNSGAGPLSAPQIPPALPTGESQKVRRFNPQTGRIE